MKRVAIVSCVALFALHLSGIASAGLFRSYLSMSGNDTNPCTLQLPCRLLPAAIAAVNDGGEIWMLDSANYNVAPVIIAKSVTILAIPGALGSIVGNGGDALDISAPGGFVTLHNLVFINLSGGVNAVNIQNAVAVHIDKTSISGFTQDTSAGVRLESTNATHLFVSDSFFRETRYGIYVDSLTNTSQRHNLEVDNVRFEQMRNTVGSSFVALSLRNNLNALIRNSVVMVAGVAFDLHSDTDGSGLRVHLVNTAINSAGIGIQTQGLSTTATMFVHAAHSSLNQANVAISHAYGSVFLKDNTIENNVKSIVDASAGHTLGTTVRSMGDNYIDNNGDASDGTVYITPVDIGGK